MDWIGLDLENWTHVQQYSELDTQQGCCREVRRQIKLEVAATCRPGHVVVGEGSR